MFTPLPLPIDIALILLVLVASIYDIRFRRIPNWLSVSGALVGLLLNSFLQQQGSKIFGVEGLIFSLEGLALGFGAYFLLYMLRAMGAGDVKLMGAVGALAGPRDWFGIFLFTAILGGVLALLVVVLRGRVKKTFWNVGYILGEMRHGRPAYINREELDVKNPKSVGLPHGAVIAVGTLFFLALGARFAG
ncbi:MAG TPA: A24 family peptidase [Bryobacteraceae bacterium]|nr:A24 family peptidase [Bryobacteraceae bacterium]